MINRLFLSCQTSNWHVYVSLWGPPRYLFTGTSQEIPHTIITTQGATILLLYKESIYCKGRLFPSRQSVADKEILVPLYITKRTHASRSGCISLASPVTSHNTSPSRNWVSCPHIHASPLVALSTSTSRGWPLCSPNRLTVLPNLRSWLSLLEVVASKLISLSPSHHAP